MEIYDKRDLRIAYENLQFLNKVENKYGKNEQIDKARVKLKKDIRCYFKKESTLKGHLVKDFGMDGFIELIELPEVSDPEGYFEYNIKKGCIPSMYDCTGQSFTTFHKIFRRNGKLMCYHGVGFDF